MGQILIRDIDDAAIAKLKAKASVAGKSTEAYLRSIIEREAQADMDRAAEALDRLRAMTPRRLNDSSVRFIRELRDGDDGH
jgi:plasmid stability protein